MAYLAAFLVPHQNMMNQKRCEPGWWVREKPTPTPTACASSSGSGLPSGLGRSRPTQPGASSPWSSSPRQRCPWRKISSSTVRLELYYLEKPVTTQPRKGLIGAGTELWNSHALGQCKMALPVEQEPSIKYPIYRVLHPSLSARYPVSTEIGSCTHSQQDACTQNRVYKQHTLS